MNRRDLIRNSSLAVMASLTGIKSSKQDREIKEEENILIDEIEIWKLHGRFEAMEKDWQGSVKPLHIYPEYQKELSKKIENPDQVSRKYSANYVIIKTNQGLEGVYGPIDDEACIVVERQLKNFLKGKNPLSTALIWDQMYRSNRHGRSGHFMMGISAIDNALWDLKGKFFGVPVYQLLGGPTRESVPVYASTLGYSLQPEDIKDTAISFKEKGFKYQKWFLPYGPGHGMKGLNFNIQMVENLRNAVGDNYELMFDVFSGWDLIYAIRWAKAVEQYRPRWIEEAFAMDKMASFKELKEKTTIPVATGEHFYNRWEVTNFLKSDTLNVVQADPEWCGGTSELAKICTIASAFDVQVVPHGHNLHAALHVVASQSPMTCPFGEYLYGKMSYYNMFHKHELFPVEGKIKLPAAPGFGLEWDENKILKKEVMKY